VDESLSEWLAFREAADWTARSTQLVDRARHAIGSPDILRVLDLCTGTGSNLRYLLDRLPGRQQWLVFDTESGARWPVTLDEGRSPILSNDGHFVMWLRPVAGSSPPIQLEAVVRPVEGGRERVVDLTEAGRGRADQLPVSTFPSSTFSPDEV